MLLESEINTPCRYCGLLNGANGPLGSVFNLLLACSVTWAPRRSVLGGAVCGRKITPLQKAANMCGLAEFSGKTVRIVKYSY